MVIPPTTRRHLRAAIRELIRETLSLGLRLHRDKRFIGRVDSGIDFLGGSAEYPFRGREAGADLRPASAVKIS